MIFLIYLGHPAQYHFFKNSVRALTANGHQVKLLIKSKDILETLLREDGFEYENILPEGRKDTKISMFVSMFKRDFRMLKIVWKFKPDVLLGSDTSVAHVAWLIGKPCITVGEDDYGIIKKLAWLMMPFSTKILSPTSCSLGPFERKKIAYEGYMKLAYLHPSVFKPNTAGIEHIVKNQPFCILRLAKLTAHHDASVKGLNNRLIEDLIVKLASFGISTYIDSEIDLPQNLLKYQLKIEKTQMHSLMSFASLIISDSQSMSVEAAMLGVPSIRFNDFVGKISVLEELEHKYQLTFGIETNRPDLLFAKVEEFLNFPDLRVEFQSRRQQMLNEKINVTQMLVWLLDNFPASIKTCQNKNIDVSFSKNYIADEY